MRLPNDPNKYSSAFKYMEIAVYEPPTDEFPKGKLSRRLKGKKGSDPKLYSLEEILEIAKENNNEGIYTSVFQYNDRDFSKASFMSSLYFDLDSSDLSMSLEDCHKLYSYLLTYIPDDAIRVYFSGGKGFHLECHPGDQKVLTKYHGYVPISDLDENVHEIIAYEKNKDRIRRPNPNGGSRLDENPVSFARSSKLYNGNMLTISAKDKIFECTPNHHLTVEWNDRAKKSYAVYLMRRGSHWRIGKMKLFAANGQSRIKLRMHEEDADEIWILGLFDSEIESLMFENIWSFRFGIPQICFVPSRYYRNKFSDDDALFVFNELNTASRIDELFQFFGLEKELPFRRNDGEFFNGGNSDILTKRFKLNAINLIVGYMKLPIDNGDRYPLWTDEIKKGSYHFEGEVYNLELDKYHHYIVNEVIVHNCEAIALNTGTSEDLSNIYSFIAHTLAEQLDISSMDFQVYDIRRMWRLPNSRHQKSGLFKVPCKDLIKSNANIEEIQQWASRPREEEIPEQIFDFKANAWYREFVYKFEQEKMMHASNQQDLLARFLEQGSGTIRGTFGTQKRFDQFKLFKLCPAARDIVNKAYTQHHLDHYERLFLCSLLTYTQDAIDYLHKVLSECSDYHFEVTNSHIQDWIKRREYGIGGRPFTCVKAKQVGIMCTGCEGMEPKRKVIALSENRYAETDEFSSPSPVRHAYTVLKGN